MSQERDIAESYRVRAEEIRIIAELDRHSETREMLERVAKDYERMARTLDEIDTSNHLLSRQGM